MCTVKAADKGTSMHMKSASDEWQIYEVNLAYLGKSVLFGNYVKLCILRITNLHGLVAEEWWIFFIIDCEH